VNNVCVRLHTHFIYLVSTQGRKLTPPRIASQFDFQRYKKKNARVAVITYLARASNGKRVWPLVMSTCP